MREICLGCDKNSNCWMLRDNCQDQCLRYERERSYLDGARELARRLRERFLCEEKCSCGMCATIDIALAAIEGESQ